MAPPLQPKPPVPFVHMRYCFEAHLNRTWATDGIFEGHRWNFLNFPFKVAKVGIFVISTKEQ